MPIQLTDVTVLVNDVAISIIPNSLKWKDGHGEQKMRALSGGGASVVTLFSNDIETNFGMVSFDMAVTAGTIPQIVGWKTNGDENAVAITASSTEGKLRRTFTRAALLNDPEYNASTEGVVNCEFTSRQAH